MVKQSTSDSLQYIGPSEHTLQSYKAILRSSLFCALVLASLFSQPTQAAVITFEILEATAKIDTPMDGEVFTLPEGEETILVPVRGSVSYKLTLTNPTDQIQNATVNVFESIGVDGELHDYIEPETFVIPANSSIEVTVSNDQQILAIVGLGNHIAEVKGMFTVESEDPGNISASANFVVLEIPEPSSFMLCGFGVILLACCRRRRCSSRRAALTAS